MILSDLIQQTEFDSPAQEALLNIIATSAWLGSEMSGAMAASDITRAQYNVLRILRGQHPGHYTCSEIAERLLDRTPDVTRLLVRLEKSDLILRRRAAYDRRVVEVEITDAGLAVLAKLDGPVRSLMEALTVHVSAAELETLSRLLEKLRTDQD